MKAKISKEGVFHIERGKKLKPQFCHKVALTDRYARCGDECPLFREPSEKRKIIQICDNTAWRFDEIIDERI
jgi:hypothetical protein